MLLFRQSTKDLYTSLTIIYSGDKLPFKDREHRKEYQRNWLRNKKLGLPTKTRTKLEVLEQVQHEKESKKKYRKNRIQIRQQQLIEKFDTSCYICNDTYRLQIHRKDGQKHISWQLMNNDDFSILLKSDDYVQVCWNCHKSIHWCMFYLGMIWHEIKSLRENNVKIFGLRKCIYHA
jgi:hypothetical protein